MKKIFYSTTILVIALAFTACEDDALTPVTVPVVTPVDTTTSPKDTTITTPLDTTVTVPSDTTTIPKDTTVTEPVDTTASTPIKLTDNTIAIDGKVTSLINPNLSDFFGSVTIFATNESSSENSDQLSISLTIVPKTKTKFAITSGFATNTAVVLSLGLNGTNYTANPSDNLNDSVSVQLNSDGSHTTSFDSIVFTDLNSGAKITVSTILKTPAVPGIIGTTVNGNFTIDGIKESVEKGNCSVSNGFQHVLVSNTKQDKNISLIIPLEDSGSLTISTDVVNIIAPVITLSDSNADSYRAQGGTVTIEPNAITGIHVKMDSIIFKSITGGTQQFTISTDFTCKQ